MSSKRLPDGYLELCSLDALESLVLSRMNTAANLRTQAKESLQHWVEAEADAKVAQWVLDVRRGLDSRSERALEAQNTAASSSAFQAELFASNWLNLPRATAETIPLLSAAWGELAPDDLHRKSVLNIATARRSRHLRLQRAALPLLAVKRQRA